MASEVYQTEIRIDKKQRLGLRDTLGRPPTAWTVGVFDASLEFDA